MKVDNFQKLYKTYQNALLEAYESEITNKSWKIAGRKYFSPFSKDIATLELSLTTSDEGKEVGTLCLLNSWLDILFTDRDMQPREVDTKILDTKYAFQKIRNTVLARTELIEANFTQDGDKLNLIGRNISRVRILNNDNKTILHYEKGQKLVDNREK